MSTLQNTNMPSIVTYSRSQSIRRRRRRKSSFAAIKDDVKAAATRIQTLLLDAMPDWAQENPYVRSGYRQISNSAFNSFKSCATCLHNETLNVYTHLIPALVLAVCQVLVQYQISTHYPNATSLDRIVIGSNVFAAIVTFTLSAGYHALLNHSKDVSRLWLRIDYVGILTLILGSFFSGIYVGFYCEERPRMFYWSMIITLSTLTAIPVLHPSLQGLRYRPLRTYAFVFTALTGLAPVGHGLYLYGWDEMWVRSGMPYYFMEGLLYLAGVFFFITHFPESAWPGKFDIWCSSHQLFHLFVVAAALTHMYGVWTAFGWNYHNLGGCIAHV